MKNLLKAIKLANYRRHVLALRHNMSAGDVVTVIRGDQRVTATVANVRRYQHGDTEAYLVGADNKFMGWVSITEVFPHEEEVRRAK